MLSITKKLTLFYLFNKRHQPIKHFLQNQKGAVLVFFVIMFSVFFILICITFEYCRLINEKIKTEQVLEQTSLMLTAEDNGDSSGTPEDRNRFLVRNHIQSFIPSTTATNESIDIIAPNQNDLERKYTITLRNAYSSVFNLFSTMTVSGRAAAQKGYQEEPMDVVFALDFSGSMRDPISINGQQITKIERLREVLVNKTNTILDMNPLNRVGLVPFTWGVKEGRYCFQPFVFNLTPDYQINFDPGAPEIYRQIEALGKSIDYVETVKNIPSAMTNSNVIHLNNLSGLLCSSNINMDPIPLTQEKSDIFVINRIKPGGFTLISSGILSGVKLLSRGTNSKKLLIIISDTEDFPVKGKSEYNNNTKQSYRYTQNISDNLIKAGMCEKIKNSGIKMHFISIGWSTGTYDSWKENCIGERYMHNSRNLKNLDDVLQQVLNASGDPVGTNVVH